MRKKRTDPVGAAPEQDVDATEPAVEGVRARGPWDASELELDEDDSTRADLGSLSVAGRPDVEVRLQVDEKSQAVQAVMLVASDGAMELRPFASARNEELWDELRPRLAEEAGRHGGTAEEVEGPYGTALRLQMPAVDPQGNRGTQPSTVLGISGPRWMLRVSMFGRPAAEFDADAPLESVLRSVVVRRGSEPMAPGDALPLTLPAGARRMGSPA